MKNLKYFWIASVVVVVMWLFNAFIYPMWVPSLSSRASNGDAFGAVNALFSGLAFAGLIYTMIMQRQELEMQRKELAAQRKEMRESRGELEEQNRIQAEQVKVRKREMKFTEMRMRQDALSKQIDFQNTLIQLHGLRSGYQRRESELEQLISEYKNKINTFLEENEA